MWSGCDSPFSFQLTAVYRPSYRSFHDGLGWGFQFEAARKRVMTAAPDTADDSDDRVAAELNQTDGRMDHGKPVGLSVR